MSIFTSSDGIFLIQLNSKQHAHVHFSTFKQQGFFIGDIVKYLRFIFLVTSHFSTLFVKPRLENLNEKKNHFTAYPRNFYA